MDNYYINAYMLYGKQLKKAGYIAMGALEQELKIYFNRKIKD